MSSQRATPVRVVVVGQGYVGLPLAIAAWDSGHDVTGFDIDIARIETLRAGRSYIEDISDDTIRRAVDSGRYRPIADADAIDEFDVAVISVPTPLLEGGPDLRYIESAAATIGPLMRPGCCVILESTTYPGTTEELVGPILAAASGLKPGAEFHLGYSPERIDPGNATHTLVNTPKVVSGIDAASLARVDAFFSGIVERTVPVRSVKVAELTKLLENTFRHVNIALVNELAMFSHELDIDIWEAIDAASTKPFGYMRFTPGPGVGGHCLPVDPSYLSWRVRQALGQPFRFVELANDVNDHMPDYVVSRVITALNDLGHAVRGRRILLLGMAYKRNTGDARESPSTRIAEQLISLGATVVAADPHVDADQIPALVKLVDLTADELDAADLTVSLVDHDAFDAALIVEHANLVLDCRHWLTGPQVQHL